MVATVLTFAAEFGLAYIALHLLAALAESGATAINHHLRSGGRRKRRREAPFLFDSNDLTPRHSFWGNEWLTNHKNRHG